MPEIALNVPILELVRRADHGVRKVCAEANSTPSHCSCALGPFPAGEYELRLYGVDSGQRSALASYAVRIPQR